MSPSRPEREGRGRTAPAREVRLLFSALHRKSATISWGKYSTHGSGSLTRVLVQRNTFFKDCTLPLIRAVRGRSRPLFCSLSYWQMHTKTQLLIVLSIVYQLKRWRRKFLIQRRRKPSFCHWNSKNRAAWMGKKVNGKIRSLSGTLESLKVLTLYSIR